MKNETLVERQLRLYRDNFLRHGDVPQGTFHNDVATQHLRFERLLRPILPYAGEGFSIHDVGAGPADLHRYLEESAIRHAYSGSEIVPEMVEIALRKFNGITMHCRDIAQAPSGERYDFVVLSGTFNMPGGVPSGDWKAFVLETIRKMFAMCRRGISFNFLTTYNTFSDPQLFYLDPLEMADFCIKELSRFTQLDHSYPLYEGTIAVFTKECVQEHHAARQFAKYF